MTDTVKQNLPETGQQEEMFQEMILEEQENEMAVIPLRGMVIFPHTESHLDLGRAFSIKAAQEGSRNNTEVLLVAQKNADSGLPAAENLYEYGVAAKIKRTIMLPTDGMRVLVMGLYPVRVKRYRISGDSIQAVYEKLPDPEYDELELEIKIRALRHQFEQYLKRSSRIGAEQLNQVMEAEPLIRQLDLMSSYLNVAMPERYPLLA